MRGLILISMAAAVLAAAGGAAWAWHKMHAPLPVAEAVVFTVEPGASVRRVAADLESEGIFDSPRLLVAWSRMTDVAGRIKAGEYDVPPGINAVDLVALFVEGRVRLYSLTIVEGWTFRQMMDAIAEHPALVTTLDGLEPAEVSERLGLGGEPTEGRFFPDTYRFPRGTTDVALLNQARAAMDERLAAAWETRKDGLPFETPYDALILASIIERETALDSERPTVAGVFVRRLEKGMRLQTDPTVIYGLGESFDGNLRRADLRRDTPYNTYTRKGLTPTPISLPGAGSLAAAVNPADGDALYFVATGDPDGSHTFSATLDEHNAAVRRYLKRLRERRKGL